MALAADAHRARKRHCLRPGRNASGPDLVDDRTGLRLEHREPRIPAEGSVDQRNPFCCARGRRLRVRPESPTAALALVELEERLWTSSAISHWALASR